MKKIKAPHVVMEGHEMVCKNCGERYKVNLPIDITMFSALAKSFAKKHIHCELITHTALSAEAPANADTKQQ